MATIDSPMAGKVLEINVAVGDTKIKLLVKKIIDNIQGISPVIARQIAATDDMFEKLSSKRFW